MLRYTEDMKKTDQNQSSTHVLFEYLKKAAKEAALGAPSFLPTYLAGQAVKKAAAPLFQPISKPTKPTPTASWVKYLPHQWPINWGLEKGLFTVKNAVRFHIPVVEEVFFRGIVMQGLEKGLEKVGVEKKPAQIASVIGNSLFFAAAHAKPARAAALANALIWSGLTYFANGSLIPAIAGHVANNTTQVRAIEQAGRVIMKR